MNKNKCFFFKYHPGNHGKGDGANETGEHGVVHPFVAKNPSCCVLEVK